MSHSATHDANAGRDASGVRRRLGLPVVLAAIAVLAAVIAVLDQVTKNWTEDNLSLHQPRPLIGEFLQLRLLYNSGAAFGMGAGITPVVTVVQIGIAIAVLIYAVMAVRSMWWTISLGLVLGGALGNIHDRLLRPPSPFRGEVVDFLELPNWPVFNIADMAVVGGAILVILLGVIGVPSDPAVAEAEAAEEAERAAKRTHRADPPTHRPDSQTVRPEPRAAAPTSDGPAGIDAPSSAAGVAESSPDRGPDDPGPRT